MDEILAKHPDIKVTKNEVRIPGYFEDGAQYANAWLASHPAGSEPAGDLGLLGRSRRSAPSARCARRAATTCKVYGINGNAQALENIQNGFMTATAWQDSFTEGYNMVEACIDETIKAGDGWQPKAVEVPAVRRHQGHGRAVHRRPSRRHRQ